jgi:hypothetical protein
MIEYVRGLISGASIAALIALSIMVRKELNKSVEQFVAELIARRAEKKN